MSRFNETTKGSSRTINRAGGVAYEQTDELKLASILLTSFLKNQFYRSAKTSVKEIVELTHNVDPLFAAKAAVYARNVFGMRSVSHVVAAELASRVKGQTWAKKFYHKVAFRPDDVTEILSYVDGKLSHAMRKGLRAALESFDAYQLAKYKASKKNVKLVDAVNRTHAHTPAIEMLVKGTLKPAETWETKVSKAGNADDAEAAKADAWAELLVKKKLGYLALLRNLRNIAQTPSLIPIACLQLTDKSLVAKSKVFPFQFLTAYEEIVKLGNRDLMVAITKAIDLSCKNVPQFSGKTLIAVDESGSMGGKPEKISSLFAAIMYKAMDSDIVMFDDTSRDYTPNPLDSTISIAEGMRFRGGGTNFSRIFQHIGNKKYDRIFILSDMQSWADQQYGYYGASPVKQLFSIYQKTVNPEVKLYSFDLQGMGDMQFPEQNVYTVAGWSDKVFDVIRQLEDGRSLVQQIKEVEL